MGWKSWEDAAERGPEAIALKGCGFLVVVVLPCVAVLSLCLWFGGCVGQAVRVADKEFGAESLLKKYEWFKDAAASLDAKLASIKVYEGRFARLKAEYGNKSRAEWPREDREQANLWESEVAGIKASYNGLAASYNAAMAKENWRWCEVGNLPPGAANPLPRSFKPYEEK